MTTKPYGISRATASCASVAHCPMRFGSWSGRRILETRAHRDRGRAFGGGLIFWDTSAVVPLLVDESLSPFARELARSDPRMLVFWTTPIECASVIARREREKAFSRGDAERARAALSAIRSSWSEVLPNEEVRDQVERLLRRHSLRAADAVQLAAALTWARGKPSEHGFACFDARLFDAAHAEGFRTLGPG